MRPRMFAGLLLVGASALAAAPRLQPTPAPTADTLSPRRDVRHPQKTATLRLAPDLAHLTPGERAAVDHLLQVGGILPAALRGRPPSGRRARAQPPARRGEAPRPESGPNPMRAPLPPLPGADRHHARQPARAVPAGRSRRRPARTSIRPGSPPPRSSASSPPIPEERGSILDDRTVVRRATAEALARRPRHARSAIPLVAGLHPFLAGKLAALAEHPDPRAPLRGAASRSPGRRRCRRLPRSAPRRRRDRRRTTPSSPATCATARATCCRTTTRAATPPGSPAASAGSTRRSAPTRPTTTRSSA